MDSKIKKHIRLEVFRRDNYICVYCHRKTKRRIKGGIYLGGPIGREIQTTLDHIIPISRSGRYCLENLATACYKCNIEKSGLTAEEFEERKKRKGL